MKPLGIDLFCGLGGWTEGLLAEGYTVIGFDIERHEYGGEKYPGFLVLEDVLTLDGARCKDAALIVASPPCQAYSYRAMPWKRAKALPPPDNSLFEACFRIQREASAAAGRHIPMVVENVRGAQKWVGRSRWNYGSYHLWGDVPALMPMGTAVKVPGLDWNRFKNGDPNYKGEAFNTHAERGIKNNGGSWFNVAHNTASGNGRNPDGRRTAPGNGNRFTSNVDGKFATWNQGHCQSHSHSHKRKAAAAAIAKIPMPLARHIARVYRSADNGTGSQS